MKKPTLLIGLLASVACSNSSTGDGTSTGALSSSSPAGATAADLPQGSNGTTAAPTNIVASGVSPVNTGGETANTTAFGGTTAVNSSNVVTNAGSTFPNSFTQSDASTGSATSERIEETTFGTGTQDVGSSGSATGETLAQTTGVQSLTTGSTSAESSAGTGVASYCVGASVPNANPKSTGPFGVTADKNVGPLAGVVPDPIYGDQQQRYNVYRPTNLAESGYCHPILIWANGYRDNPEQNAPDCVVDSGANRWCGQYLPLMNHLASHGFVVVASLSTATAEGDPLPTIAGLDWILEQAEDSTSPYYHRLDTANIGQLGHSYGGMSTCMSASEPRYKALATICGTRTLSGVHTPMLFFCGGNDTTVECAGVKETFLTVTDQPAFFINELNADHGSWVYQGANGVSLSAAAAWFRAHLMSDTESRKHFYGADCTFCSDNRVEVEQNSLMLQ